MRKEFIMKKLVLFVLVLLLLIPTAGFAQDSKTFETWEDLIPYIESLEARIKALEEVDVPVESQAKSSDTVTNDSQGRLKVGDIATIGDFTVQVESVSRSQDYAGKQVLVVNYKFTNNSDKSRSFGMSISPKVFQNGIEAAASYDPKFSENFITDIRPGVTLDVKCAYVLVDTSSLIEVELDKLITFNPDPVIFEIPVP